MTENDIDTMVHHYAIAALWSSTDDRCTRDDLTEGERCDDNPERDSADYCDPCRSGGGKPLDALFNVSDIDANTMAEFRTDCAAFYESCADDLTDMSAEQTGHDFWLTRNGHGAGFWDRGLGERGDRLSAMARPYGEVNLYVADDGSVSAS
jgi:hypothetical protein